MTRVFEPVVGKNSKEGKKVPSLVNCGFFDATQSIIDFRAKEIRYIVENQEDTHKFRLNSQGLIEVPLLPQMSK